MDDTVLTVLQWFGAGASLIAAALVAADINRKVTGWAFVLFVAASIALLVWGFMQPDSKGIGVQNAIMLVINLLGVYRYLIVKKEPA